MQPRTKYPRTFHLDFSPGVSNDDKVIENYNSLEGKEIVVTTKLDGENTSLYSDYLHARSIDGKYHPSRDWVKAFHASIKHNIPVGDRICGENLYAKHSIYYENLESYFYGFSYWSYDLCLDYDSTLDIFKNLNIYSPKILYRGPFDLKILKDLPNQLDPIQDEGFVVRVVDAFHLSEFQQKVAKWVRPNHVETDDHWMYQIIVPNKLVSN